MYAAEDFGFFEDKIREAAKGRSDDSSFALQNVPTLFFSTSIQDDYHKQTDTIDKIDVGILRKITRAVLLTLKETDSYSRN